MCLEDRNADVRKKANEAVLPFMIHTGYDAMVRHAAKVKVIILLRCYVCYHWSLIDVLTIAFTA